MSEQERKAWEAGYSGTGPVPSGGSALDNYNAGRETAAATRRETRAPGVGRIEQQHVLPRLAHVVRWFQRWVGISRQRTGMQLGEKPTRLLVWLAWGLYLLRVLLIALVLRVKEGRLLLVDDVFGLGDG